MENTKPKMKKEIVKMFAVGLAKESNGVKPGLYAGVSNDLHIFLTEGTEDKERGLVVELLEDKKAAEQKLDAIQAILIDYDLEVKEVEVEIEVEDTKVQAGN